MPVKTCRTLKERKQSSCHSFVDLLLLSDPSVPGPIGVNLRKIDAGRQAHCSKPQDPCCFMSTNFPAHVSWSVYGCREVSSCESSRPSSCWLLPHTCFLSWSFFPGVVSMVARLLTSLSQSIDYNKQRLYLPFRLPTEALGHRRSTPLQMDQCPGDDDDVSE